MSNLPACAYIGSGECPDNYQYESRKEILPEGIYFKYLEIQHHELCSKGGYECPIKKNLEIISIINRIEEFTTLNGIN
jgi:hypothetical protein